MLDPIRAGAATTCVLRHLRWRRSTSKIPSGAFPPHVHDELAPGAWHCTELYANNRMEADHGRLKRRLRPMRGQNIRRGYYELGVDEAATSRVAAAFDELALAI